MNNEKARKFLFNEGDKQRRKVLGDAHVDKCEAYVTSVLRFVSECNVEASGMSDFARAGQELVTEAAW